MTRTFSSLLSISLLMFSGDAIGQRNLQTQVDNTADEGITGPVHQKNIGKILFANAKIDRASMNSNEAQYKSSFNVGDIIYGRFYLAKGINKYLLFDGTGKEYENDMHDMSGSEPTSDGYYLMYIDGQLYSSDGIIYKSNYVKDDGKFVTTGQTRIVPNADDGGPKPELVKAMNALTEGSHEVKVDFYGGSDRNLSTRKPLASGTFTLNKSKGAVAKTGKTFEALQAGMKDSELEARMLSTAQKKALSEHWKEKLVKVKISSEDWEIRRDEITREVTGRVIRGWVYTVWPDGHCGYQSMSFIQSHDGTNFQNSLYYNSIGDQTECDCSK